MGRSGLSGKWRESANKRLLNPVVRVSQKKLDGLMNDSYDIANVY